MFDNIEKLIDENLSKIKNSTRQQMWVSHFIGVDNKSLNRTDRLRVAELMESYNLIDLTPNKKRADLSPFGYDVISLGGWIKYNESEKQKEQELKEKNIYKENLELEIKELQKDSLNYQQTIRQLEENLKISSLLKNWWWLIGVAITLGITIGKWLV